MNSATALAPELIPHEWDIDPVAQTGSCRNPDIVIVDLSNPKKDSTAEIYLGVDAEGRWHYGYNAQPRKAAWATRTVTLADSHATRADALRAALAATGMLFNKAKDKAGALAIAAYYDAHFAPFADGGPVAAAPGLIGEPSAERLPANTVAPAGAQLPRPEPLDLPLAVISPNLAQPRREFNAIEDRELADGIASVGLLHRIGVRELLPEELGEFPALAVATKRYELIYGERRLRAFRILARDTIPCEVYRGLTRAQATAAALVENLQREGLNPIEEAEGFKQLMAAESLTQEQCALRVGKSRPVIANALRVLDLPPRVVQLIRAGELTVAHGVALARFKAWPAAVEIMAEEAVAGGLSAAALEKDVPCLNALIRAEVVAQCHAHEVDHEWPATIKKHPAYFRQNEFTWLSFDPPHWAAIVKEHEEARRAAVAAQQEKDRKAAEKAAAQAAKNPAKIKSLADLPLKSYRIVEDQSALALLPEASTRDVPRREGGEQVTVCTATDLASLVEDLIADAKRADRKPKWQGVISKTLAAIGRVKKLGARELTLLFYLAGVHNEGSRPTLTEDSGKPIGVKLPKKMFSPDFVGLIDFTPGNLSTLNDAAEPIVIWRVLIDQWLRDLEDNLIANEYDFDPSGDLGTLCKWLLAVDDLGFLEETKAGLKQIQKLVEDNGEYQAALAAATGATKTPAKGKK